MTTVTVGIEGPVLAGKSSVVKSVARLLNQRGIPCTATTCFVDAAQSRGMAVPDFFPTSASAQIDAARFYLAIDEWRRPHTAGRVMLLDRTCWTLLAHGTTLAALGFVDAVGQIQTMVGASSLRPDALIYLDVSHAQQLCRANTRNAIPPLLLEKAFNDEFRKYFLATRAEHLAHWVDADREMTAVTAAVESYILQKLDIRQ